MACIFARRDRNRLDDTTDLAFEVGSQIAPRRVAIVLGLMVGLDPLGLGAGLGGVDRLHFRALLRRGFEQLRELMGKPDQDGRFHHQNDGMQHHAPEIGAAREDRRGQEEIQDEMMQRNRDGADHDRPVVAIGDQQRQRREEIHVHVDLPGGAGELKGEHRDAAHQRDGRGQAGRQSVAGHPP